MSTAREPAAASGARAEVAAKLARLLADSYTLYRKTHSFHWNVVGPHLSSLHTLFETQYTELALAVDEIAERITALGHHAPGSYAEFATMTSLSEATGDHTAMQMVEALARDNETAARTAAAAFAAAQAAGDQPSCDLTITRQRVHEKSAWMLRSFGR